MNHYSPEEWVDFAREVASPGTTQRMREHLDEGCPACRAVLHRLQTAGRAIRAEEVVVPDATLRRAYAIFSGFALEAKPHPLSLTAKLWFDSFSEAAPHGVRTVQDGTRQLSYRVGEIRVDLSIEDSAKDKTLTITGQIHGEQRRRQNLPVWLLSGERMVANGITSEFGEFVLTVLPRRQMQLSIVEPAEGTKIVIPLPELRRASLGAQLAITTKPKPDL
jgi:hypothetical protein